MSTRALRMYSSQGEGQRPKVVLHKGDPEHDPLVIDQVHGISITRAQEQAERAMHRA